MALTANSLFLYGFQITELNQSIDFKAVSGGPEIRATIPVGFYSLTSLGQEIVLQMNAADTANEYSFTVDRTVSAGTQNRVTIATDGIFLSLLFGTGSRAASSIATLIGYTATDKTGFLTYQSTSSSGTVLITNKVGYGYSPPELNKKVTGSINVSASGDKESIVWGVQQYFNVAFKYIPQATAITYWSPLMEWMMLQRPIDFTPEVTAPTVFYSAVIESTSADGKGLGFLMPEMLPNFKGLYETGLLKFRVRN